MELDPSIQFKIFLYLVIVISAVFHEFSHGWVANYLGDPTARYAGRLTLNPLKHIDPIGTVIVPLSLLFFFGGAGLTLRVFWEAKYLRPEVF